jgi:hypothetical protein
MSNPVPPAEYWRWLTHGLGGLTGMLENVNKEGPPMPRAHLESMKRYRDQISAIIADQEARKAES